MDIREEFGSEKTIMIEKIKMARLGWVGHVKKMDDGRVAKTWLER